MSKAKPIYRVVFIQHETLYEVYAQYISEDDLMGFISVENLVFSETKSTVVIDPSEEKLKAEFRGVKRCYIPMHSILRIDEVEHEGTAKIKEISEKSDNISHFPRNFTPPPRSED